MTIDLRCGAPAAAEGRESLHREKKGPSPPSLCIGPRGSVRTRLRGVGGGLDLPAKSASSSTYRLKRTCIRRVPRLCCFLWV